MKILKYFLIVVAVLLVALFATPFLFKGKIVKIIKEQANDQLNARLNFDEGISMSLFRSFPDLSVEINQLSVSGIQDFEKDTLFSAQRVLVVLDIMSVIRGDQITVRKVVLDQPRIKALVLSDGRANWDITKTDTTAVESAEAPSPFHVKLKFLEVNDGYLVYDDREGDMYSELKDVDYTMEGDFTEVLFTLKNKMSVGSLTFGMEGVNYLSQVNATALADIDADMNQFKFIFKDNTFTLNNLELGMNGSFAMPGDDMLMDLTFLAKQNEFKNFLSLIPALYANDFKDLQSKGKMALEGFVKGTYNDKQMPGFGLKLNIDQGWFKYPALPMPVEKVDLHLSVQNPDGDMDHTEIDLSKLHFEIQGDPFDAKLYAKNPMSDPYIDAYARGVLNLDHIVKIVPMPKGTVVKGIIRTDIMAKGKVSTLEKGNYEGFDAKGNLLCQNIYYAAPDLPKPFEMKLADMQFTPKIVTLKSLDAKIGRSDMKMNGELNNFYSYYLGKAVLKGNLQFSSNVLDANEFLSEEPTKENQEPDTSTMAVFEVPKDIDFTLKSSIGKLIYTNMLIENFVGNVKVQNQRLNFENISMNTLGSDMKMTGFYETTNPKHPGVEIQLGINNLDIQKAFKTFNTVKKLAPAAENIFGSFSTTLQMKTLLDEHMQPDYNSLYAVGLMSVPLAEIKNIKVINKISELLKKPEYNQVGLYNTKIKYKIEKGRVHTEPFNVKMGPQTMALSGSTGLDQTIDYNGKVNIPRKDLGVADQAMNEAIAKLNQASGTQVKLNESLPVQILLGGTFTSPTIKTNIGDLAKNEAGAIKDQLMQEAMRKKKELEDKARAEAEKLKAQAEKMKSDAKAQAEKLKADMEAKARAEADRLKKEAEAKAKAEAEALKNKAKEDAKSKLKGLLGKP